jgi:hypothetical protein
LDVQNPGRLHAPDNLTTWVAFDNFNCGNAVHALRRRLIALASTVLACQLAAIAAAPVLLHEGAAASAGTELLCDCKVEPGAECPMHGGRTHGATGKKPGAIHLSPVCGDLAAAVLTLLGSGSGILVTPSRVVRPATTAVAVVALANSIVNAPRPPTSPPPRS